MKTVRRQIHFLWRGCLFVAWFIFGPLLFAADVPTPLSQYTFRAWRTDKGLPHNSVQAVCQTADGYLWVGTRDGLARFDGIRFTVFNSRNTPALKHSTITALLASSTGELWIGTMDGLCRFSDGRFSHHDLAAHRKGNAIQAMAESDDGSLWIGTMEGAVCYKAGAITPIPLPDGMRHSMVRALCETPGGLMLGGDFGCCRWSNGVASVIPVPHLKFGVAPHITAMFCDSRDVLWIGTTSGLLQQQGNSFIPYTKNDGLTDTHILELFGDRRGNFWAASVGNLHRLDGNRFVAEPENPCDEATAMFEDREGNIWIGAKDGLHQWRPRRFVTYTKQQGLAHNHVTSLLEDSDGTFWIGTWGGGLHYLREGKINSYAGVEDESRAPFNRDLILAMAKDSLGRLWVSTDYESGLFKVQNFDSFSSMHFAQRPPVIRAICEEKTRRVWLGGRDGIRISTVAGMLNYTRTNGLAGDSVRAILKDRDGNLWAGTSEGLSCWKEGQFTSFTTKNGLSHNDVSALHQDKEGTLWVGTLGGGLNRLRKGRFTFYQSKHGLFSDEIFEILEDNSGWLWMSCGKGVFRVHKEDLYEIDGGKSRTLRCFSYGVNDGMASSQCNGVAKPAAWKSKDGRLWFATIKGAAVIDPSFDFMSNETAPPVFIERVIADKREMAIDDPSVTGDAAGADARQFKVPPGRGNVEIHYTALSFQVPEENEFKYRLEGADADWVEAGTRRVAYYNNLPPGEYTFRVMGCNNDGIWNSLGSSVQVSLQPHYWQTWWFKSLSSLSGVVLVGGFVRFVTRKRLERKLLVLEKEKAVANERTRIAQDMHDELGARLSEILHASDPEHRNRSDFDELKKMTGKIHGATRDLVDNLDAIVWAVNPKHDTLDRTLVYMSDYAQTFLESAGIRCCFDVPDELPPVPFSSETRHNLFLVLKEALNNVVKYADASTVTFQVEVTAVILVMTIHDNGKGFLRTTVSSFSNGLENMEARTNKIGGTFQLSSEPGMGTRVELRIPLAP